MSLELSEVSRIDLRSRLSARAVVAGAIVELVLVSLLLTLAAGLGLWSIAPLTAEGIRGLGAGFALWSGISWVLAAFLGGFVAAAVSRSTHRRDGLLHGLVSWAAACLTAAVLLCTWFMAALAVELVTPEVASAMGSGGMLVAFFLGDLLALLGALAGGLLGARSEAKATGPRGVEARAAERRPLVPAQPAPQPT